MQGFEQHGIRIPHGATGNVKVPCPKCSPERRKKSDPCLSVNIAEGVWNCHHCSWSGTLKRRREEREWRSVQTKPLPVHERMYKFFETRGIPRAVVDRNRITSELVYQPALNREESSIAFNYYVGETLVNVKYRGPDKSFTQVKGGEHAFYKINDIKGVREVIICEGEMDALAFEAIGLTNAVSVPNGGINANAKSADGKLKALETCWEFFEHATDIYLATDTDAPGIRLREELAERLGKHRCWIVKYPDGCKDGNDVLMKHGPEQLRDCVFRATAYPIEGVFAADSLTDEMNRLYEVGYPKGAKTGVKSIDSLIEWHRQQLTVWTGVPGHMKSSVCDQKNMWLARGADWRFAYFTPEHYPLETHLHRLAEQIVGRPLLPDVNGLRMTREELCEALEFLRDRVYYILPEDDSYTLDQILDAASYLRGKHGIDNLVIDPWNHVEHQIADGESETLYTGRALRQTKQRAREDGYAVDLIAHPTKLRQTLDGTFPVATMYDISGSSNWYNVPDNGITIYRVFNPDQSTSHIEWHQRKVKYQFQGRPGVAELGIDGRSCRFTERLMQPF